VHIDWHVGHYVKILLDDIFGKNNFKNEIIWHYRRFSRRSSDSFPKLHDTIFTYSKGVATYNPIEDEVRSRERYEKGYHVVVDNGVKKLLIYNEERAKSSGVDFQNMKK